MRILLDTNAYSAATGGHREAMWRIREAAAVYLPVTVLGELLFGFLLGSRERENRTRLEQFLASPRVGLAGIDLEVCEAYARIGKELRESGSPIPANDRWIAATAIRNNLVLLSRDRHFDRVPGLAVSNWDE